MKKKQSKTKSGLSMWSVILILVAIIVVISMFAWAKYLSMINGNSIADVAQFNFKLANGISQTENITNFAITREENDTDSVAEGMLAPGTKGQFAIGINAIRNRNFIRICFGY